MGSAKKRILPNPLRQPLAFLSLGPNGTYYARGRETTVYPLGRTWNRGKGSAYQPTSYELPQSLISDTRMAERLPKKWTQVWLGRHGSWVVHWNEGIDLDLEDQKWDVKWHLNDVGLYPGLERFLWTYKTVLEGIKSDENGRKHAYLRRKVHLMVSLYPLTRSIPAPGNTLGRQRDLAIQQRNNC